MQSLGVLVHSLSVSCPVSFSNRATFTVISGGKISSMRKPLSAMTLSPTSSNFKNPHSATSLLSEMFPLKRSDTKQTAPDGVMATKAFKVL